MIPAAEEEEKQSYLSLCATLHEQPMASAKLIFQNETQIE